MKQPLLLIALVCVSNSYCSLGRESERSKQSTMQEKLAKEKAEEKKELEQERLKAEQEAMEYLRKQRETQELIKTLVPQQAEQPKETVTTIAPLQPKKGTDPLKDLSKKVSDFIHNYFVIVLGEEPVQKLSPQELQKLKTQFSFESVTKVLEAFNRQLEDALQKLLVKPRLSEIEKKNLDATLVQLGAEISKLVEHIKLPDDEIMKIEMRTYLAALELNIRRTLEILREGFKPEFSYQRLLENGEIINTVLTEIKPFIDEFYRIRSKLRDKQTLSNEEKNIIPTLLEKSNKLIQLYAKNLSLFINDIKQYIPSDVEAFLDFYHPNLYLLYIKKMYYQDPVSESHFEGLVSASILKDYLLNVSNKLLGYDAGLFYHAWGAYSDTIMEDRIKVSLKDFLTRSKILLTSQELNNKVKMDMQKIKEFFKNNPPEKFMRDALVERLKAVFNTLQQSPKAALAAEMIADILISARRLIDMRPFQGILKEAVA